MVIHIFNYLFIGANFFTTFIPTCFFLRVIYENDAPYTLFHFLDKIHEEYLTR
jgi:hypothetical protein